MRADMTQLGMDRDAVFEPERAQRSTVFGDQRDRNDLTSLGISQVIDQADSIEHRFSLRAFSLLICDRDDSPELVDVHRFTQA